MVVRQFTYKFEELPIFRLPGGGFAGKLAGAAHIQFDEGTRGWKILNLYLHDEAMPFVPGVPLVPLVRDYGEEACGPWELLHDALIVEREEEIGGLVDAYIDGGTAA